MIKLLQPCFVRIFSDERNQWVDYSAGEGEIFAEGEGDFSDLFEGEDYEHI
jgi:hypothetical protein